MNLGGDNLIQLQTTGWNDLALCGLEESFDISDVTLNDVHSWMQEPQYVEVRANNNGEALTQDELPQAVYELGYEDFSIDDQTLLSDTLPSGVTALLACHNSGSVWELNMNDISVEMPLDSNSVQASFLNDGRVNTDLDVSDFNLEFEMQFYFPKNFQLVLRSFRYHL